MRVTIDRAGRIVVPRQFRDRLDLVAGTELEIEALDAGLKLRRIGSEPTLRKKKGFLVHHGAASSAIDVVEFIRAERETRSRDLS